MENIRILKKLNLNLTRKQLIKDIEEINKDQKIISYQLQKNYGYVTINDACYIVAIDKQQGTTFKENTPTSLYYKSI